MKYASIDRIREFQKTFGSMPCWKVGLAYGTVIYFEMGDVLITTRTDRTQDVDGEASLVIYSDAWKIYEGARVVAESQYVERLFVETKLMNKFRDKCLLRFEMNARQQAVINFQSDLNIVAEPFTARGEEKESMAILIAPNGQIVDCSAHRGFYVSGEQNRLRANNWLKKGSGRPSRSGS